ncbi:uncharacterized protein (TIGR02246 family) [Granulicella aggregans]|uniref:Uncharacterized protein (TIGR02246 family) n=2 Tax=Granulicella aggregans TaxID=474949 RepID=A0A7W7ZK31_9BACT|nr:uncharacterized protein (TIGR02246 family) [Granulicella aggregans]
MVLAPAAVIAQKVPDEAALRSLFQDQEAAWNRGDGVAFAAAFTEDSDFINVRGDLFHGRTMIAARHAAILSGPLKGSHNLITIRTLTPVSTNLAIVETDHSTSDFRSLPPGIVATTPGTLKTRMTYVARRQSGKWSILFAQNTAVASTPVTPTR